MSPWKPCQIPSSFVLQTKSKKSNEFGVNVATKKEQNVNNTNYASMYWKSPRVKNIKGIDIDTIV